MRIVVVAVVLFAQTGGAIFRFETDGFWLNLHHFLYVLGRAEAKMPDVTREAVAGAPADEADGIAALSPADQQAWRDAVAVYASGISKQDTVFDPKLVELTNRLRRADSNRPASALAIDSALAKVLDRAAPIYRRVWWPRHRDANRAWLKSEQDLISRQGPQVLAYVTRAYQESWMNGGYPVNISAWSNWAGAYSSTIDSLLVVSSLSKGNAGSSGFEIAFHEAMHQWDDAMYARLARLAKANNVTVKDNLTHALIFYTAGEAVKSVVPGHTPYAEAAGLWRQRGLGTFKPALDAHWKPYLDGNATLDEALSALLKAS